MPDRARTPLGEAMRRRREELGLSIDEVAKRAKPGSSEKWIRNLETGVTRRPQRINIGGLENALQWAPGTIRRILQGGEPEAAMTTVTVDGGEGMTLFLPVRDPHSADEIAAARRAFYAVLGEEPPSTWAGG